MFIDEHRLASEIYCSILGVRDFSPRVDDRKKFLIYIITLFVDEQPICSSICRFILIIYESLYFKKATII